jgi:hypothetical protein
MNDINQLMFTKYLFRVAKAEVAMYSKRPIAFFGFETFDTFLLDVPNPTDALVSPVDSLVNRAFMNPISMLWEILFPNIANPIVH